MKTIDDITKQDGSTPTPYELALMNDKIAKREGWTPMSEGLPKDALYFNYHVLCPDSFKSYNVTTAMFSGGLFYKDFYDQHQCISLPVVVDYWMEIPRVPEINDSDIKWLI